MTEENYRKELVKALNQEKDSIISNINSFLQMIPEEAIRVNIIISPSQDGEGDFNIHGGLNGPDLYHLNNKVEEWTNIFEVKHGVNGFEPDVPMVDPFDVDYYVNDIIDEVCCNWLNNNWDKVDDSKLSVGLGIYSDHL